MTTQGSNINNNDSKSKNPFTVPENYFASFESKVMNQIQQEEPQKVKTPIIQMVKPYLYLAASFILFFIGGRFVITQFSTPEEVTLSDNSLTFEQEMDLIYSEVNDFTITDYLLESDLNNTDSPSENQ